MRFEVTTRSMNEIQLLRVVVMKPTAARYLTHGPLNAIYVTHPYLRKCIGIFYVWLATISVALVISEVSYVHPFLSRLCVQTYPRRLNLESRKARRMVKGVELDNTNTARNSEPTMLRRR